MTPKEAIYLADYCIDNTQVREALKAMAMQVEELQDDAQRYRDIRSNKSACRLLCGLSEPEELDSSIDEARKSNAAK